MPEIKEQSYKDERGVESMEPFHKYARTHKPGWTYKAVRVVFSPIVVGPYRTRQVGKENIPAEGPVILAPNHFSNMDHFFCGVFTRREIRFMSKSQLFGANPALTYLFKNAGHFPVRRGHADDEAFATAHSILERDGCVGIYAEGGRSRTGELGEPKAGVGRLALETGAPVVPVAIHGSKDVRGWRRGRLPKITVRFGEPLSFEKNPAPTREEQMKAAQRIFDRVKGLYALSEKG